MDILFYVAFAIIALGGVALIISSADSMIRTRRFLNDIRIKISELKIKEIEYDSK